MLWQALNPAFQFMPLDEEMKKKNTYIFFFEKHYLKLIEGWSLSLL
jgi:hypothetical protein